MKKILFIILLFCSLGGKGGKYSIGSQKIYPSLLKKNFILLANTSVTRSFQHRSGLQYDGDWEMFSFQKAIIPELVRDYVDRYYRFDKKTVLYMNPNVMGSANICGVKKDTIFFQYLTDWIQQENFYWRTYDNKNTLSLIDYAIVNRKEIEKNQILLKLEGGFADGTISVLTLRPKKILKILQDRVFVNKVDSFLRNTKKYPFITMDSYDYGNFLRNSESVSCYYQNESFHFYNKRNGRVFFEGKEIRQFVQIGTVNFLIILDDDMIYNYNSNIDSLTVFLRPDIYHKSIFVDTSKPYSFAIFGNYYFMMDDIGKKKVGEWIYDLLLTVSRIEREYTYLDTNKLPVLTNLLDAKEAFSYMKNPKKLEEEKKSVKIFPFILFPIIASLLLTWVVFFFVKINLVKKT